MVSFPAHGVDLLAASDPSHGQTWKSSDDLDPSFSKQSPGFDLDALSAGRRGHEDRDGAHRAWLFWA